MVIYGVALLSGCYLVGLLIGEWLGRLLGVDANVGGVGFAMLLLIGLSSLRGQRFEMAPPTAGGINFWNAMYIPIVIAMAAKQNVLGALSGGWMAIIAGAAAVAASFLMIPVLARLGAREAVDD